MNSESYFFVKKRFCCIFRNLVTIFFNDFPPRLRVTPSPVFCCSSYLKSFTLTRCENILKFIFPSWISRSSPFRQFLRDISKTKKFHYFFLFFYRSFKVQVTKKVPKFFVLPSPLFLSQTFQFLFEKSYLNSTWYSLFRIDSCTLDFGCNPPFWSHFGKLPNWVVRNSVSVDFYDFSSFISYSRGKCYGNMEVLYFSNLKITC